MGLGLLLSSRAEVWQERQMRQAVIEEKERALATREDGLAQALREKDAASRRAQSLEEALRKSQVSLGMRSCKRNLGFHGREIIFPLTIPAMPSLGSISGAHRSSPG